MNYQRNFESTHPRRTARLYTERTRNDYDLKNNAAAPFRRLLTVNPSTIDFDRAYNAALALDRERTHRIILRRFRRFQKSKFWPSYAQLRDTNKGRLPDGFLWMQQLEKLAAYAQQSLNTAQQISAVLKS